MLNSAEFTRLDVQVNFESFVHSNEPCCAVRTSIHERVVVDRHKTTDKHGSVGSSSSR